ncbi:hypothetical protein WKK05_38365 (plasmid) [Nostoc sp. UHCC 0302]|uniref:hypothetical protein n=1 Tax=Nostoc sp. UHCC 0302 TaxID=3134896 RepID=UPI00311CAF8E
MSDNKKVSSSLTLLEPSQHIDLEKLAFFRSHRQIRRLTSQQVLTERIFEIITITSIVCSSLFGISTLSCWALEIMSAEVVPTIENQPDWHKNKHICFGWMLIALGSFCGSATFNQKAS